jgi:hypothetical protein
MVETSILIWGIAILVVSLTWIPALLASLGASRYTNGGEDSADLEPASQEFDYRYWYDQVVSLGYEPIGTAWMSITFNGPKWRTDMKSRVFYSRAKQTFLVVQKQPSPQNVWWLNLFITCFADGGLLLTHNTADEPPQEEEYTVQGMESDKLAAVEALHLQKLEELRESGRRLESDHSLDALLKFIEQNAGPAARQVAVREGQSYLLSHLTVHATMTFLMAMLLGIAHVAVATVNLVLAIMFWGSEYLQARQAGQLMRQKLRIMVKPIPQS